MKTQISPGIRPVWSESLLFSWRKLGSLATHWAHNEDDWSDAQAVLSLRWAHKSFCWFCHQVAQMKDKFVEVGTVCIYFCSLKHSLKRKYSSVFRENRCPPPPKPVYGGNFSHEAVTFNIRSRSPKSYKLLILSDLYRFANLETFHPMVHEITCRQHFSA